MPLMKDLKIKVIQNHDEEKSAIISMKVFVIFVSSLRKQGIFEIFANFAKLEIKCEQNL